MIQYYKYSNSSTDFTNYYKVIENNIAVESIKRSNIEGKIYYIHDYIKLSIYYIRDYNKIFWHGSSITISARNWYKMIRKINIIKK
jgi:hypothetical protein